MAFKGFQNSKEQSMFQAFPKTIFGQANNVYGFPNCALWLDAAYGLNTQTNLASISRWQDRIIDKAFVQSISGNQPRLILTDASFNNLPSVQFQSTKNMGNAAMPAFGPQNQTFVLVYQKLANATGVIHTTALVHGGGTFAFATEARDGGDGVTTGTRFYVGMFSVVPLAPIGQFYSTAIYDLLPHIVVISGVNFIADGVALSPTGTTYGGFQINTLGFSTANNSDQKIAELLLFNNALSSDDCIRLCNNINSKYALY